MDRSREPQIKNPAAIADCQLLTALVDVQRLNQAETDSTLCGKTYFFLARRVSRSSPAGSAHYGANHSAFAAASQRSNQRSASRPAANVGQVPVPEAAAFHKQTRCLNGNVFSIQLDRGQCQAQVSGIVQMSGFARRYHPPLDLSA